MTGATGDIAGGTTGAPIYLDNAATTRPFPEVVAAVARAMEAGYGNPSSRHGLGLEAARLIDAARAALARTIGADPGEIVFTGGGSEANNLALKGAAWAYGRAGRHIVVSAVEHPSVLETARWLAGGAGGGAGGAGGGAAVTYVPVGPDGRVSVEAVLRSVTDETVLVSLMHVNNEVGAIQPVAEVGRRLRTARPASGRRKGLPLLHVDAVQSLGRLPIDVRAWGADLVSVSGHKVHGPKGVGALFVRNGVRLVPLIHGGGHEAGRRSGTENVPGIAGFGVALERLAELGPVAEEAVRLAALRRRLVAIVRDGYPALVVNGPDGPEDDSPEANGTVAPHILSLSFPGIPAEVLQHHLERSGIYVSTGSACSSHHQGRPSHVLEAMACPPGVTASAVRLSLSRLTTGDEVERAGRVIAATARELGRG